jgi:uncharacterized membrane protein YedE/YeeE
MQAPELATLNAQLLWLALCIGIGFGAIAQRTHFCTMGAVSDLVNMGDWTRMRQWALAVGLAMVGFGALVYTGRVDPAQVLYASNRWIWLSALVGGSLFGLGMVLASGCGSKTLVRIGGGSLKSLVVLLVLGASAFATLKGVSAVLRVATVDRVVLDISAGTSLAPWVAAASGLSPALTALLLGLGIGGSLMLWAMAGRGFRTPANLLAGAGMGGLVVAMWWVSGHLGHLTEHPETLQETFLATNSGRAEALSFVAPVAYLLDWLLFFSDKSKVLTMGITSTLGVVLGSWCMALATGSFRWDGFASTEDLANHLVGAALMGVGGVTAMGCTVGQGLSGLSTLSVTSVVAVAGILVGAVIALRYQVWRVDQLA